MNPTLPHKVYSGLLTILFGALCAVFSSGGTSASRVWGLFLQPTQGSEGIRPWTARPTASLDLGPWRRGTLLSGAYPWRPRHREAFPTLRTQGVPCLSLCYLDCFLFYRQTTLFPDLKFRLHSCT